MKKEIIFDDGYHELDSGAFFFIKEGKFHNLNGPAVRQPDGSVYYYVDGLLHREDGPAIESSSKENQYFIKGKLHRQDGPAIESYKRKHYFLCGKEYSYEEWLKLRNLTAFI